VSYFTKVFLGVPRNTSRLGDNQNCRRTLSNNQSASCQVLIGGC